MALAMQTLGSNFLFPICSNKLSINIILGMKQKVSKAWLLGEGGVTTILIYAEIHYSRMAKLIFTFATHYVLPESFRILSFDPCQLLPVPRS